MHAWKTSFVEGYRVVRFYVLDGDTLIRSCKIALVVGSVLGVINHGAAFLAGHFTAEQLIPFFVTYLVPFIVATYGQIQGKRQRDRIRAREAQTSSVVS